MRTLKEALRLGWDIVDLNYQPNVALVERKRSDGLRERALCRIDVESDAP